jgi:peptidoglycan-associated lipoprotein
MKKYLLLFALTALLAGCASGVKLDDVPVDERSGSGSAASGNAGVAGLDARGLGGVGNIVKAGPAGVETVIYFDYDSYSVKPEFQNMLDAHARFLRADKNRKAAIEGHTDERGGREYNLALGQKRAEAVRRALTVLGVPDSQIEAVSFGKEKPAVQGMDESAFAKNRRAEISYR